MQRAGRCLACLDCGLLLALPCRVGIYRECYDGSKCCWILTTSVFLWRPAFGSSLPDVVLSFPLLIPYIADFPAEPSPVPKVVRYAAFEDGAMMGAYLASALLSPYCYQGDS